MKLIKGFTFFMLFLLLGTVACIKQVKYPNTPQIEFLNFYTVFDTGAYAVQGIMSISFTDGDGNIGLTAMDTLPPYNIDGDYYYNYVITFFGKVDGVFTPIDLEPPFSVRIPLLNPGYPGKAIKGVIWDTLSLSSVPHPLYDTIRFEAFIYDRDLNKSNVITTPEIILKKPY